MPIRRRRNRFHENKFRSKQNISLLDSKIAANIFQLLKQDENKDEDVMKIASLENSYQSC